MVVGEGAQGHGARCGGRSAGSVGRAAAFSFYRAKDLGAQGEGGAVTTDDGELAERVRALRNYGSRRKHHHEVKGFNSRLDELQAALRRVKLGKLAEWNARRAAVAQSSLRGIANPRVAMPTIAARAEPNWHLFVVRTGDRDRDVEALARAGVQAQIHYPIAPHEQPAYAELERRAPRLAIAEAIHREAMSLPMGPHSRARVRTTISKPTSPPSCICWRPAACRAPSRSCFSRARSPRPACRCALRSMRPIPTTRTRHTTRIN